MKIRAYLDIETTGLSRKAADLTVVGVAVERAGKIAVSQLIGDEITEAAVLETLKGVDEIYTYNGKRFDLPFIKAKLTVDLAKLTPHTDLMFHCWKQKLKGGLKAVERKLGIERQLIDVDGYMAVVLWYEYINNRNNEALKTLKLYNQEDVVNLAVLREKLSVE